MMGLPLSFAQPLLLLGLLSLPVLWWLLRVMPPRPRRVDFPPTRLLLEIAPKEETPARTPWWLTALRLAAAALVILAAAGPVWNPQTAGSSGNAPLVLLIDDGWSAAPSWELRLNAADQLIAEADSARRAVALLPLSAATREASLQPGSTARVALRQLSPKPYAVERADALPALQRLLQSIGDAELVWLTDGVDSGGGADFVSGLARMVQQRPLIIMEGAPPAHALAAADNNAAKMTVKVLRAGGGAEAGSVRALDQKGAPIGEARFAFTAQERETETAFELPVELRNDITRETPACFEPALDYVVTKVPRFAFEKFPGSNPTLTTSMKSVGETMAIGKTFQQSIQKALRSLEIGRGGFGADGKDNEVSRHFTDESLENALRHAGPIRIFHIHEAFARGWSLERIQKITRVDPWFLSQLHELVAFEEEIRQTGSLAGLAADVPLFRQAKEFGYSDKQLAFLTKSTEAEVRATRAELKLAPVYGLVDTCAAEFKAFTPYFYSTWSTATDLSDLPAPEKPKKKIMILGGGPNRIGQGIEFDYCCVHACYALREAGFETLMVNSNPETVSTDYDTSDKLYFEPVTLEDVLAIYRREACDGVIVQFGGQTPLNLAKALAANGVTIIGTSPESIEKAEDREFFKQLADKVGVRQPDNGTALDYAGALAVARRIGFPVLVRPSFVLGGRAMAIVYDEESLADFVKEAFAASEGHPVLIDKFLEDAIEVDVDCIADGEIQVLGAIMEHVEKAGIHSGDSACSIPPRSLKPAVCDEIRRYTHALAKELNVVGLMNVQYAVQNDVVYILEVNPRASRTVPYVSKAIGVPLARLAALVMAGSTLKQLGFTQERAIRHFAFKEAVLPFNRFPGCDALLTPEMHSTGEVMGIDTDPGMAYVKSQLGAGNPLPLSGSVFLSVADHDKKDTVAVARELSDLGYTIYATRGTATAIRDAGIKARAVFRISEGRPNALDLILDNEVQWIVNVPSGAKPAKDEVIMRTEAIRRGLPITTTVRGLQSAVDGIRRLRTLKRCEVLSLQEFNRKAGGGYA